MQHWDSVDRTRGDLRAWLHNMQEEVDELENQPSKLHAEACEVDISRLQGIREEVQARGPAVEGLLTRYRELTQHNPDLQDPVVKAVKDDWEELLGQIENLIVDREQSLQAAKELQARENEMDDDLENYINELEKIESADVATTEKAAMMKVGETMYIPQYALDTRVSVCYIPGNVSIIFYGKCSGNICFIVCCTDQVKENTLSIDKCK